MHPVLFQIGSFDVRIWGIMVSLGIIAGTYMAQRMARREGMDPELIFDFIIWGVVAGFLGARAWEMIFSWQNYVNDPLSALAFWNGGLSIQGAVAGGLLYTIWFIKKHNIKFWYFADILAPGLILGQAIGRIGCFFNGDAYGIPTQSWIGVLYSPGTPAYAAYGATPLVPAELMEGAGDFAIMFLLLYLFKRRPFQGFLALMYFVLYSLLRFTLEFWRGDSLLVDQTLKAAQVSSLAIAVTAIVLILFRLRKTAR
jgi:phosphatidylglycerol:prolipoprotein diacylglycerol transferase